MCIFFPDMEDDKHSYNNSNYNNNDKYFQQKKTTTTHITRFIFIRFMDGIYVVGVVAINNQPNRISKK